MGVTEQAGQGRAPEGSPPGGWSRAVAGARRATVRLTVAAVLAGGAVVAPVATLPAPAAHVVKPHSDTVRVPGRVDHGALRDRTALRPAQRDEPAPAGATEDPGSLAVLGTKTVTQHFLVAGVTWAPGSPAVVEAAVRVLEDGTWSGWTDLDVDDTGVPGERPGTDPLITGGADGVQVRILTADGMAPADVRVDVIDPGTQAADATVAADAAPAASAQASTGYEIQPKIVTRKQWGADERRASSWPEVSARLQAMYVHHTAGTNGYTKAQAPAIVRGIYAYHTGARNWPDIGYQFLVDKYGTIYQGRQNAINDNPLGAQAGGYNTGTIGVSAMGNYQTARPSSALLTSIEKVLAWKAYEYGLNPTGHASLLTGSSTGSVPKHKAGTRVTVPVILGHRDTNGTACPGTYLYQKLPTIRKAVASRVSAAKKRYGAVRYTTGLVPIVKATSAQAPVQWSGSTTYSWKAVPGAKKYQVLTRSATRGATTSLTDTRYWTVAATVSSTHATISSSSGSTKVVAIRAVDANGRLGPSHRHTQATRPLSASMITRSPAWKTVKNGSYYRDAAWRATSTTASMRVTGLTGVRQIVVRAPTAPGDGRIEFRHGSSVLGTISLSTAARHNASVLVLPLRAPVSGTITLVALDGKQKRISALAFPRTAAAKAVGVSHAAHAATPTQVAVPPSAAVVAGTAKTFSWHTAAGANRYEVWVRSAAHGHGFGSWKHVATTRSIHYRLAMKPTGTTWQVRVRSVGGGGSSAFATFRQVTRPVSSALLARSKGWTKKSDGRYYRDAAWQTSAKGATISVTKARSVKRVRLIVRTGPGEGRLAVYVGGVRVGTRSTAASRTTWAAQLDIVLSKARSGTVVVRTLDRKAVRVSAIGLGRS